MGTRSTIAILQNDGTVKSVYAHWDGYISGNGVKLYQHYQNLKKVKELISLGGLSSLRSEIYPPTGVKHTFDAPCEDVTVFYGRDRGETGNEEREYLSLEDYAKDGDFQEYDYVFKEKNLQWYLLDTKKGKLKKLETLIKNDESVDENIKKIINSKKLAKKLDTELILNKKVVGSIKI